jgi:hypothetical protein
MHDTGVRFRIFFQPQRFRAKKKEVRQVAGRLLQSLVAARISSTS